DHAVGWERHLTAALVDCFLLSLVRHGARPPISTLLRQAHQKAAVHERRAAHFPLRARKAYPPLKATVRYFHAMNHSAARDRWQPLHSGDEQRISLDRDLDILRFDAGERRHDRELPLALEYVDRRLPVRRRCPREAGPEELTMQLLRPLDHRAGFGPHPVSRIGCGHCTCLSHNRVILSQVLEHVRFYLKHVIATYSVRSPPPCGEGDGGGGSAIPSQVAPSLSRRITPLPSPPPQGGREQTELAL